MGLWSSNIKGGQVLCVCVCERDVCVSMEKDGGNGGAGATQECVWTSPPGPPRPPAAMQSAARGEPLSSSFPSPALRRRLPARGLPSSSSDQPNRIRIRIGGGGIRTRPPASARSRRSRSPRRRGRFQGPRPSRNRTCRRRPPPWGPQARPRSCWGTLTPAAPSRPST